MKRTTILVLSLVFVLVFSMAAFAQINTNITGLLELDVTYREKITSDPDDDPDEREYELYVRGRRRFTVSMSTGGRSGNLRAVVGLNATNIGSNDTWVDWTNSNMFGGTLSGAINLSLNNARFEATGPWWEGGPSLLTRAGRFRVSYSDWVAGATNRTYENWNRHNVHDMTRNAIEVRNIPVGPMTVHAFMGISDARGNFGQDRPSGFHAAGNVAGLDLKVTAINREKLTEVAADRTKETRVWDVAVEASAKPISGVSLSGVFAMDGQGEGYIGAGKFVGPSADERPAFAYRVDATVETIPNLKLTGSYYLIEERFAPRYANWNNSSSWEPEIGDDGYRFTAFEVDRTGFKVGAETTQAGVKLNGSFLSESNVSGADYSRTLITAGASTKIENFDLGVDVALDNVDDEQTTKTVVTAGTSFGGVNVKYTGTIETDEDMENKIEVDTTRDLIVLKNVKLSGAVIQKGEDLDYGADATWTAPNGVTMVVGYATYNKSGDDWVRGTLRDGFYLRWHARLTW